MKKITFLLLALVSSVILFADLPDSMYVEGKILFRASEPFNNITIRMDTTVITDQAWFNNLAETYEIDYLERLYAAGNIPNLQYTYKCSFPDSIDQDDVTAEFKQESKVISAYKDIVIKAFIAPNDGYYNDYNWHLNDINAEDAWDEVQNVNPSEDIIVAVLDTGIDYTHPDLVNQLLRDANNDVIGEDFTNTGDFIDDNGHGTHVAGILAAETNNWISADENGGVASIAGWNDYVKIYPFKVLGSTAGGNASDIVNALDYIYSLTTNQPRIINMSLGTVPLNPNNIPQNELLNFQNMQEVITLLYEEKDIMVIAASGNNGDYIPEYLEVYPASLDNVYTVAATNHPSHGITLTTYSNYAEWVNISAPGGVGSPNGPHSDSAIISTVPTYHCTQSEQSWAFGHWSVDPYYDFMAGTSMAAPIISGVFSLMIAKYYSQLEAGTMDISDLEYIMEITAYDFSKDTYYEGMIGAGLVNAGEALGTPHPIINYEGYEYVGDNPVECGGEGVIGISIKNLWADADNVTGILETDDAYINFNYNGGGNSMVWGDIEETETVVCSVEIEETSGYNPRTVEITLHLSGEYGDDEIDFEMDFEFELPISPSLTPYAVIFENADYIVATDIVIDDIDQDGLDDIIVTSVPSELQNNLGDIYYYREYSGTISLPETMGRIECTPAVGDINSDGFKEIVAADKNGDVYIWNYQGVIVDVLDNVGFTGRPEYPVVIEDVTGDGQLDIIIVKNRYAGSNFAGIIVIEYDNVNDEFDIYNYCSSEKHISAAISVADVNGDTKKEIIVPFDLEYNEQNIDDAYFGIFGMNSENDLVLYRTVDYLLSDFHDFDHNYETLVGDINEDGEKDIVACNYYPDIPTGSIEINYYNYISDSWTDCASRPIGDFSTTNKLSLSDNTLEENGLDLTYINPHTNSLESYNPVSNSFSHISILPECYLKCDINSDKEQDIIIMSEHQLGFNGFPSMLMVNDSDSYFTCGLGKINNTYDKEVIIVTTDGKLFLYPLGFPVDAISEYEQIRGNSRHTGSYYQSIPQNITTDLSIRHDAIIDHDTNILRHNNLIILVPGTEIRFEEYSSIVNYGNLSIRGSVDRPIYITGMCKNNVTQYWTSIKTYYNSNISMHYANISNANVAVNISDSDLNGIFNSKIHDNDIGILVYNGSVKLAENFIYNNGFDGLENFHEAVMYMGVGLGNNAIYNNNDGLYLYKCYPVMNKGHNDFDNQNLNIYNILAPGAPTLNVGGNWWGSPYPVDFLPKFYDLVTLECEIWDLSPNTNYQYRNDEVTDFETAMQFFNNEEYVVAIPYFISILEDENVSENDIFSISALFSCYSELDNLEYYESYINSLISNSNSETLIKACINCLALVNRRLADFDEAIGIYEDILMNNPSYEDSCYAVIDLGYTYLESENRASGLMSNLVPSSQKEHDLLTQKLLSSIRTGISIENNNPPSPEMLTSMNYPNPFNPETNIVFYLPQDGHIELSVYNIKGQKVKTLINDNYLQGKHITIWDGTNERNERVGSGVYFYRLSNEKNTISKKILFLK